MKGFLGCLCLWLCLALLPPVLYGDAVLKGIIVQYDSGGKGVTGVVVEAMGENANPKTTGKSGYFEMVILGKERGDRVFLSLRKEGWEAVSTSSLEVALRKNPDDMVKIDMWRTEDKKKRIGEYAEALKAAIEKHFRELLAEIRGLTVSLAEKDKRIAQLQAERDTALTMVREQAEQMAKTDLDGMSEMYRKADGLIKAGKLEEAYNALDDHQMDLCLRDAQKKIEMCVFNYLQKARIAIIKLRFDKAGLYFEKALDADPDNHDIISEYGEFLYKQHRFEKALEVNGRGHRQSSSDYLKAMYLNNMGTIYIDSSRLSLAQDAYTEALKHYRALAAQNPRAYLPDVAGTLNNLGVLYKATNRLSQALEIYTEALKIRRQLAAKNPEAYLPDVARTLNCLGLFYTDTNRLSQAQDAYTEALKISRQLAAKNPEAYLPDVAMTLNNLGILYNDTNRLSQAQEAYTEALKHCRALAAKNPEAYLPDLAMTLNNLGSLYFDTNRLSRAQDAYTEALKIRQQLAANNPEAYLPDVAMTLNNLGVLYKDTNRLSLAEDAYSEALKIRRQLATKNPEAYLPYVAATLNNLGLLYKATNRLSQAQEAYTEALKIRRQLSAQNPEAYLPDVADTLNNLGLLHATSDHLNQAVSAFDEALTIREKLAKDNPQRFDIALSTTLISLALCYLSPKYENFGVESIQKALSHLERARTIARKYPQVPKAQQLEAICTEILDDIKKNMKK